MKLSVDSSVPVYTIAGSASARPLPEWLARKRKRSLKTDPEYSNRVELLQDFEFEEASACVRVSEDGEWVMSTGTYKPQMHVHYLPHLALSFARNTSTLNQTFVLLSSDYGKSLHLQTDRSLEFHTPGGLHYSTRIPRYGRDLKYNKRTAEALIPAVGVDGEGNGEVFRLNLEVGRFMKGYQVDVGGDDVEGFGAGALQGSVRAGSVNCAAVAEDSHGLLAFGTSLGTVEFWDPRSRNRVSALNPPAVISEYGHTGRVETTALEFHRSGLQIATGDSLGMVYTYDLRSPVPLLRADQGYGSPIQNLKYLSPSSRSASIASEKLLSSDKRCIKIWDAVSGDYWTSVEPAVDLNHVEWVPDSGMILTANEGRQQHAFFIPQLGPAPRWCGFLDNVVEEMAEDADDPSAYSSARSAAGDVYANYKFLDMKQLRELSLDHLIGQTNLLRPYMHGYFVAQKLYEQARLLTNPDLGEQQRQKSIQEKIDKEREGRIRGNKKVAVKVNRKFAEKMAAREEANERRRAQRVLRQGGDEPREPKASARGDETAPEITTDPLGDSRFGRLFEDEGFEIDETSREFQMHNPSTVADQAANGGATKRGLTAVEDEELNGRMGSSDEDEDEDDADEHAEMEALRARARSRRTDEEANANKGRIGNASYKKSGHRTQQKGSGRAPSMQVSSSTNDFNKQRQRQSKSFGDLASGLPARGAANGRSFERGGVVGEKQVTFAPAQSQKKKFGAARESGNDSGRQISRGAQRRSASGNTFRRM